MAAWDDMSTSRRRLVGNTNEWMSLHQLLQNCWPLRADRHEQAQLPRDDLRHQADRLQPIDHAVGEAGELDTEFSHDLGAAKLEPILKLQDRPSVEHRDEGVGRAERWCLALDCLRDPGWRDQPADDAFPIVGLEPVDAHGVIWQPLPD